MKRYEPVGVCIYCGAIGRRVWVKLIRIRQALGLSQETMVASFFGPPG